MLFPETARIQPVADLGGRRSYLENSVPGLSLSARSDTAARKEGTDRFDFARALFKRVSVYSTNKTLLLNIKLKSSP